MLYGVDFEFHLLIGADQALEFRQWKDWQGILELATPAVILRPPLDERAFREGLIETHGPEVPAP